MIIMDGDNVLIQKRKGSKLWPSYYALPAGHIDEGENQYEALIREAKEELNGVTLESLVVAERVARAIKVAAARGVLDAKDFPLLMHVDEIICQKKPVNLPWEHFTFCAEV